MDIISFILLVLLVIISSGIVSGSEAALLSVSYTKSKEILNNAKSNRKKKKALSLLTVKENIQKYITTIVVLNNIINIVGSIYVGVLASKIFGEIFLGVVSGILTFLIIMFSEIIPKVYGEKHSEMISLKVASPLIFITKLFTPINFTLNKITNFFVKEKNNANYVSEGEIMEMAALGKQEGSINTYESEVIENVFKMNDIEAYDIMIPKNKVSMLDINDSFEDIVKASQKTGFTRFPVSKDHEIIGLINIKDLFKFHGKEDKFSVAKILRPITYAPEAMKIFTLEEKLKKNRIHMAVIVNEHGDFTGIVTLEDIIEELLGEIEDEFDDEDETGIKKINENKFEIKGDIEIDVLNHKLDLELDENQDYTTLNGFLISQLDKLPRVNDGVKIPQGKFRVTKASRKRVLTVEFAQVKE